MSYLLKAVSVFTAILWLTSIPGCKPTPKSIDADLLKQMDGKKIEAFDCEKELTKIQQSTGAEKENLIKSSIGKKIKVNVTVEAFTGGEVPAAFSKSFKGSVKFDDLPIASVVCHDASKNIFIAKLIAPDKKTLMSLHGDVSLEGIIDQIADPKKLMWEIGRPNRNLIELYPVRIVPR